MTPNSVDEIHIPVQQIMTTEVVTTSADADIEEIAGVLRTRGFGGLPVVDENDILIGIVSEFDIISKRGKTASDIMSRGVIAVGDETSADQVTSLMGLHGIRRVPIVRNGKLVGIVTRSDLLRLHGHYRWTCQTCGDFERGFSKPVKCRRCFGEQFSLDEEQRTGEGF